MESTKISLIGSTNNIFIRYPSSFWLIVTAIVFVTSALFYVNNFWQSSNNNILHSTTANTEKLSGLFNEIEGDSVNAISPLLEIYKSDINNYDNAEYLKIAEKTINTLYTPLIKNNEMVSAYFYILNDSKNLPQIKKIYESNNDSEALNIKNNISEEFDRYIIEKANNQDKPFWELCVSETGENLVSYIIPLSGNIGAAGIVFSVDELFDFIDGTGFSRDNFPLLLSKSNGIIMSDNPVSEPVKEQLINAVSNNSGIVSLKKNDLTFFYFKINDDLFYIEAYSLIHTKFLSNVYIFCLGIVSLFCVWITQVDRVTGINFIEVVSQKSVGKILSQSLTPVSLNSQTATIAFQISLTFALLFRFLLSIFSNDAPIVSLLYLVIFLIGSVGFLLCRKESSSSLYVRLFVFFVSITPVFLHFLIGGYLPGREPYEIVWIVCAVVIAIFLLSRKLSHISFSLIVIMILVGVVIERMYFNSVSATEIFAFSLNIIFVCLLIFSSVEIYFNNTKRDFNILKDETIQIKETQSAFVHKEKMVTLGQLIAGVAHEINTPIGAVKAAGETLETNTYKMLNRLISETRDYSNEDLEAFIEIVKMCVASIKEMRSTMETRKAKAAIREYFKSVGLDNYAELTNLLTKLEICDIEKIDDNLDLFFNTRIIELLNMVTVVMPFLNGTQTVIFASNRVAKIVFALKAFAHTSSSSEFIWFDIAKNIENIIILYHNQIKAGIEVTQDYDDNIPDLFGNPDEIGQVWTNLVQNAIYAMSGVGTLKISIQNDNNKWVRVSFSDTGTGIKEESVKHIFEAFYTTKPLGEGSGLGLDICKKIIQKHEGTIEVSSKYGSGTTFTVSLPIKDKE